MATDCVRSTTLWLIRHGESTWNAQGLIQGHSDAPWLTALGRQQAAALAASVPVRNVAAVFSSDLRRAEQTAGPIATAAGVAVISDPRLRERSLGVLEGLPTATLTPDVTGITDEIVTDPDAKGPGMESLAEVHRRAHDFLAELVARPWFGDVVVVTHGGALRMLRALCQAKPLLHLSWDPVPNAHVERRTLRMRLSSYDLANQPHKEDVP